MPPRRKAYRKKRAPRRKAVTTTLVNTALQPIAQRYISRHKYVETNSMALSNAYSYQFNLNSVFDPNRSGIGHKPYMTNTMSTLYNRYRVLSCSYTISAYNSNNTVLVSATPANNPITFSTTDEAMENPRTKWVVQTAGGTIKTLKGFVNIASLMGRTKAQYLADDNYQALTSASPSELGILNMAAQSIVAADVQVDFTITLNYLVEWFDPKNVAQS